jgi:dihydrofolate synthase / folylpolyglutamate synthase
MTYKQTLEFLYNQLPAYHRIGKAAYKNSLDNSLKLDAHFGHPHRNFKSVHVAGTNGKGSVSHMLASVLQEAGYRTGLYTSPHLKDFRERIRVDGRMIPENEVIAFTAKNSEVIKFLKPSFFEISVAMAFDYFARSNVDIAVIEVGLGGRLDSTNIINPLISVITNIGFDHTDLLGDTLGKIAAEKAGIIKPNVPVVISETQEEIQKLFISAANEMGSEISFADQNFICNMEEDPGMTGKRRYIIKDVIEDVSYEGATSLGGDYQCKNLMAVYQVYKKLKKIMPVSEEAVTEGISKVSVNTGLSGRWQILGQNPLTICDTGHNKEGLEYVLNQVKRIPKTGLHIIIGFVNDKDLSIILPLFPEDAVYYFTKASVPRALEEHILLKQADAFRLKGKAYPDVKSALNSALKNAADTDMIFIGGSTFIVADAL